MSLPSVPTNPDLQSAAIDIVKRLGGRWRKKGGMCLCPAHDDHDPSLSVRVGDHSLLFHCFAGCNPVDVIRAIRRRRLDVPVNANGTTPAPANDNRDAIMAERAQALWDSARPFLGSPAEVYARRRGLMGLPQSLRYHPRTPLGSGRDVRFRPALLAAIRSRTRVIAVERLFLDLPHAIPAADLDPPRLMLGRPFDGAVRLGEAGPILGLAEGWATAWSARMCLGIPVWAALGNKRLPSVFIPPEVEQLILLPDNDAPGLDYAHAALEVYDQPGRAVEIMLPPDSYNDWNDYLVAHPCRNGGEKEEGEVREAA
jgi:hypothetical protein